MMAIKMDKSNLSVIVKPIQVDGLTPLQSQVIILKVDQDLRSTKMSPTGMMNCISDNVNKISHTHMHECFGIGYI